MPRPAFSILVLCGPSAYSRTALPVGDERRAGGGEPSFFDDGDGQGSGGSGSGSGAGSGGPDDCPPGAHCKPTDEFPDDRPPQDGPGKPGDPGEPVEKPPLPDQEACCEADLGCGREQATPATGPAWVRLATTSSSPTTATPPAAPSKAPSPASSPAAST